MRVVVTGGAGFIGSNLAEELLKKHEVTVIDNLSTGRIENLDQIIDKINFIEGSITDQDLLKEAFSGSDTVFHQAAIPSVQRSVDNPIASNEANVEGTLKVLVAARDCNVRKVVYASSSSAYGDTPTLPKKEEMKPNILAMQSPAEGVFNIACGQRVSLNELAGKIMKITGVKLDPIYDEPRQGDVRDSLADISSARDKLGYRPDFDLDSGLEETIRWFRKN